VKALTEHFESRGEKPYYGIARYHHKDGSTVWIICSGHVTEWNDRNEPLHMVGSHINITSVKNLEKSLYDERELLRATLLSIGDGVISTNKDGNIEMMNTIAENMTGWTQEEAAGKSFDEVFHIKNELTGDKCDNPVRKVLDERKISELAEHTILISRTGDEKPIEDSAAPIKDEDGNINGAVVIFRDFTEKKE
jgi:PAS domain S-box-containing protein